MNQNLIILPVAAQGALTFVVLFLMAGRRRAAIISGKTRIKDIALGQSGWPDDATKAARSFANQLETPVLFYVACAFALITKQVDYLLLGLAWGYVALRVAHAVVHVGANPVMLRFRIFVVSVFLLMALWLLVVLRATGVL